MFKTSPTTVMTTNPTDWQNLHVSVPITGGFKTVIAMAIYLTVVVCVAEHVVPKEPKKINVVYVMEMVIVH